MDEPIIIDGVDVSGCRLYLYRDKQPKGSRSCGEGLVDCNGKDCLYKQLQRAKEEKENLERKIKRLEKTAFTEESCPHCDNIVELPPYKGIYECPECGKLIVCCSTCDWDNISCNSCKYTLLIRQINGRINRIKAGLRSVRKRIQKSRKREYNIKNKTFYIINLIII